MLSRSEARWLQGNRPLVWLGVEEGSIVRKGEILARIENDDVLAGQSQAAANLNSSRSAREQLQAELHDAELSFNRIKILLAEGIVSTADFDAAQARYRKAQARCGPLRIAASRPRGATVRWIYLYPGAL
jgi:multidrug efflux pump subunit AcrA (membrane-fusion protein)